MKVKITLTGWKKKILLANILSWWGLTFSDGQCVLLWWFILMPWIFYLNIFILRNVSPLYYSEAILLGLHNEILYVCLIKWNFDRRFDFGSDLFVIYRYGELIDWSRAEIFSCSFVLLEIFFIYKSSILYHYNF